MKGLPWTPWHKVVELRDDLKSGELSLSMFAADLYDVVMGEAQPVYQDPEQFFALTYPTHNLRELVKDVLQRLAGKNDKAVRQLELTYGGGKTHTLITLLHLVSAPDSLPDLQSVKEFIEHAGIKPPQTRVAVLAFDKLDVEKGMEIVSPDGETRWLRNPWSVLAWQIAGPEGLALLHPDNADEERDSAPAENLMADLLALPQRDGLATLVLIDEVLMYAREKIGLDPEWQSKLKNFFQYLTQAAAKPKLPCCVVASLLATDPAKSDDKGREIISDLHDIFNREREEGIQPVEKTDVAEVLRRRFFKPESIADREDFKQHCLAALHGIREADEHTQRQGSDAEERYVDSYPFHPDLTEVLYSKWTNLEGFQRTRGVLRTFALALRDAERWDTCPLVGCNVFLTKPDQQGLSPALLELTRIATADQPEGKMADWEAIMQGELAKARVAQVDFPGLHHREVEQAAVSVFLHSQPTGQRASTPELMVLLGQTRPDRIELGKAMLRWGRSSWFLDENLMGAAEGEDLPQHWRLGPEPNLKQMHDDACRRVLTETVDTVMQQRIRDEKGLTAGASAAGARPHMLPIKPSDIDDDGEFHYAVLGPSAASMSGKPSAEAQRFIDETTSPDRPRVYRNAVVLAVPSRDGLDIVKQRVREYLGWEEVREALKKQGGLDESTVRSSLLAAHLDSSRRLIRESIRQTYCIVVTVSEKNEVHAFKVAISDEPLFNIIKSDPKSRIQEQPVNAEALLPGGPYDLWREGETSRLAKDLIGAFAQLPHLQKMLRRQDIVDTLSLGARSGLFVLKLTYPGRTVRTVWLQEPSETDLKDPGLEVVLPHAAELAELPPHLLKPGTLPGLWPDEQELSVADAFTCFGGGKVVEVQREGYTEPLAIPKADRGIVEAAIKLSVEQGHLWLLSGPASLLKEPIPAGILSDEATLLPPPAPVPVTDVLPESLPEAWENQRANAAGIQLSLSRKAGRTLPWCIVRDAIDGAIRGRMLEKTPDSGPWPCELGGAQAAKFQQPAEKPPFVPPVIVTKPGVRRAEAELTPAQIQDLADVVGEVKAAAVGTDIAFKLAVELGGDKPAPDEVADRVSKLLKGVSEELGLK